jgi:transcriptional regulator with XRE-family HTH domain
MLDREWLALRTDSAFLNRLAARFFELRIRRYPTQEEAASRLGVTTKDIQRIEQGLAHLLSFHKIERLAKLAGTKASYGVTLNTVPQPA